LNFLFSKCYYRIEENKYITRIPAIARAARNGDKQTVLHDRKTLFPRRKRGSVHKEMSAHDENEDTGVKVKDRRKFNVDGSLREGYEPSDVAPKPAPSESKQPAAGSASPPEPAVDPPLTADEEKEMEDLGADDPASFVNFLTTLVSQAAAALGAMPHPATGQRTLDLETGRYWIDVLAMLKEKTKGNLHPKESQLFDGLLSDLRMQYVQINRMAEEKLKQQAAKKFSGQDILGKKV
jgi:Domain of unknown function (DUF1844)